MLDGMDLDRRLANRVCLTLRVLPILKPFDRPGLEPRRGRVEENGHRCDGQRTDGERLGRKTDLPRSVHCFPPPVVPVGESHPLVNLFTSYQTARLTQGASLPASLRGRLLQISLGLILWWEG